MASTIRSTTQHQIDVEDVLDNLIIQKDGSVSLVLKTNAINFGLLSEEEQDATIYTYAAFLNSLTFSIQILIRSDVKDISNYIHLLEEQEIKQANPLKKSQITRYKQFIASLITERNVLEKSFYIVIPFSTLELGISKSFSASFFTKKRTLPFEKSYIVEKARANLDPKRDHIIRQIARIGLSAYQLNTQELIQLLFSMYNASSTQGQKITNTQEYTVPLVQPAYIKPKEDSMDNSINQNTNTVPTSPASTADTPAPAVTPTTPPPSSPVVENPVAPAAQPTSPNLGVPTPTTTPATPPAPTPSPAAQVTMPTETTPQVSTVPNTTPPPVVPSLTPSDPTPLNTPEIAADTSGLAPLSTPTTAPSAPEKASASTSSPVNLDDAQQAINSAAINLTGTES